jgi:hypothetical protein
MPNEREVRVEKDNWGQAREFIYEDGKRIGEYRLERRGLLKDDLVKVEYDLSGNEVGYSRLETRGGILGYGAQDIEMHYDAKREETGFSRVEGRGGVMGFGEHPESVGYDTQHNEVSSTRYERRGGFFGLFERTVRVTRTSALAAVGARRIEFRNLPRVRWGVSAWIAVLRGLASSAILLPLEYRYQPELVGEPSLGNAASFISLWTLGSLFAPIVILILKGIEALFNAILWGSRVGTLIAGVNLFALSIFYALGDPILFLLKKIFPGFIPVQRFGIFNLTPYIFALRDESVRAGGGEDARQAHESPAGFAGARDTNIKETRRGGGVPGVVLGLVLLAGLALALYASREQFLPRSSSVTDESTFTVRPYDNGPRVAREDGSRYRQVPFANDTTPVLAETTSGEPLDITGIVEQSDGLWYQVRLADGSMGYIQASLTLPATESAYDPPPTEASADHPLGVEAAISPESAPEEPTRATMPMLARGDTFASVIISALDGDRFEVRLVTPLGEEAHILEGRRWRFEATLERGVFRLLRIASTTRSGDRMQVELDERYSWPSREISDPVIHQSYAPVRDGDRYNLVYDRRIFAEPIRGE